MKPTFANLVAAAAASTRLKPAHVRRAVVHLLRHAFEATWATGHVVIPGFVTLRTGTSKSRRIKNPVSGEAMVLPAGRVMAARVVRKWRRRG